MEISPPRPRIVVVDDEVLVREVVKRTLSEFCERAQVTTAESGASGLELCRGSHFDLIVVDIKMRGLNGIEMLLKLRKSGIKTPAVIFSSSALPDRDLAAMKPFVFVPKPEIRLLLDCCRQLLTCDKVRTARIEYSQLTERR